jgi:hypothetical protein
MGKATQRRERRLTDELRALFLSHPQRFHRVWRAHLNGWCTEIVARGRDVRRGRAKATLEDAYALLEKGDRVLKAMGLEVDGQVGAEARSVLKHECAKAVAGATDVWLYRFETDSVHRLMQTRPQSRARG